MVVRSGVTVERIGATQQGCIMGATFTITQLLMGVHGCHVEQRDLFGQRCFL
jgi:hypothetical protein